MINNSVIAWGSDRWSTTHIVAKPSALSEALRASCLVQAPAENLWGAAALLKTEIKWKNVCSLWCNYLSWISICSQAGVPSPLQCVPGAASPAGCGYLCRFPRAVCLGSGRGNFSLWHPPPIQHLRIYVNILAVVTEITNAVTPPN